MFKSKGQALLGLAGGLALLAFGIYSWLDTQAFFKTAQQTTAIVSSVTTEYENDGDEKNTIYYDYSVDGKEYTEHETISGTTDLRQGDQLSIYYDPSNPSDARFKKKAAMLPWLLLGGGALILIMALVTLLKKQHS